MNLHSKLKNLFVLMALASLAAPVSAEEMNLSAERLASLCDRGMEKSRIHWEEGQYLAPTEFEQAIGASRAEAMVAAEDVEAIESVLESSSPLSVEAAELLSAAASFGNNRLIEKLLVAGVPADGNQQNTMTPLLAAISCGRVDAVAILLDHGADPNLTSSVGSQEHDPMLTAISNGSIDQARLLAKAGYDPCAYSGTTRGRPDELAASHPAFADASDFRRHLTCSSRDAR